MPSMQLVSVSLPSFAPPCLNECFTSSLVTASLGTEGLCQDFYGYKRDGCDCARASDHLAEGSDNVLYPVDQGTRPHRLPCTFN